MHRILGEVLDTLCLVCFLTGGLFCFSMFFSDSCQLAYAEYRTEAFLDEIERKQEVTGAAYEAYAEAVQALDGGYQISVTVRGERSRPQYEPVKENSDTGIFYTGMIKEEQITIPYEEFLALLSEHGSIEFERGDCITICIEADSVKRSLVQKIIRR